MLELQSSFVLFESWCWSLFLLLRQAWNLWTNLCSSSNNRTRFEASGIKNNERGNPNSKIVACGYLEHSHKLFSNRFRFAADFFCSPFYVPVVYTRFAIFFKDFSSKKHKICKITRQLRRKWEIILHAVCSPKEGKSKNMQISQTRLESVFLFSTANLSRSRRISISGLFFCSTWFKDLSSQNDKKSVSLMSCYSSCKMLRSIATKKTKITAIKGEFVM